MQRFGMIAPRLLTQILAPTPHGFHRVLAHVLTFNRQVIGKQIFLDQFNLHDKDILREGFGQAWYDPVSNDWTC